MKLPVLINRCLAHLNVAVTKRTTLNDLVTSRDRSVMPSSSIELKNAICALQKKVDESLAEGNGMHNELIKHQISVRWNIIDAMYRKSSIHDRQLACPLCGHQGDASVYKAYMSHCIFEGGSLLRHQCPRCDVIFGAEKMFDLSEAELSQDYKWHYRVFSEGDSTNQEIRAFESLSPVKTGVYLNYGAGSWSRSVQELRHQGWNVLAFEPHSSSPGDMEYVIKDFASLSRMKFDGIFSNNVLEHLRQPIEDLHSMASLLNPGAMMAHATPCFEYLYEFTRFHLFFFAGRSKEVLASKAGLQIEDFEVDGEFMNCIFKKLEV